MFYYDEARLSTIVQKEYGSRVLLENLKNSRADNPAEAFYLDFFEDAIQGAVLTIKMAKAMQNHNHYDLAQVVSEKYGSADDGLVQYAEGLARNGFVRKTGVELSEDLQKLREAKLDASIIAGLFTWAMEQYREFSHDVAIWPVEILTDCSAIDVRDKSSRGYPLIAIPKTREVDGLKLAELIGHEIECHWRNSQNASLLGLPKLDDETVYEGIAKVKDYRFNERYAEEVSAPIPYYILAQQFARAGGSFAETANYLVESYGITPGKSWIYTYRTFRGASDMNNSACYALTKDRAYLEGFLYVQQADADPERRSFLSFGTLSKKQLEKLSSVLSYEEAEEHALPDLDIQSRAIQQILARV